MVYIEGEMIPWRDVLLVINLKRLLKTNMFLIEKERQILFLENLLTKLKSDHMSVKEQQELSEFYINYMFSNQNNQNDEEKNLKYMSLGWYFYEILNK